MEGGRDRDILLTFRGIYVLSKVAKSDFSLPPTIKGHTHDGNEKNEESDAYG